MFGVLKRILFAMMLVAVLALVAGSIVGQPILLSYATSGSMAPTIDAGDGYLTVPVQVSGSIEEGDVIVFNPEEINGGELTVHRVVEKTEDGFVTKGDANSFTDQDDGEPPIKRPQVVAEAMQVNGNVVVAPELGTAVEGVQAAMMSVQRGVAIIFGVRPFAGIQGIAYLLFTVSLLWYGVAEWRSRRTKTLQRERSRSVGTDTRYIAAAFAGILVLSATAAMVGPTGTHQYGVVSAEFESESPNVIPQGQSAEQIYSVNNSGLIPTLAYFRPGSDHVEVEPQEVYVDGRSANKISVTLHAPQETGYYRYFVVEYRYLVLLPPSVIRSLFVIHPWAPIIAIDTVIAVAFYTLSVKLLGSDRIRTRSRKYKRSVTMRIRKLVNSLY